MGIRTSLGLQRRIRRGAIRTLFSCRVRKHSPDKHAFHHPIPGCLSYAHPPRTHGSQPDDKSRPTFHCIPLGSGIISPLPLRPTHTSCVKELLTRYPRPGHLALSPSHCPCQHSAPALGDSCLNL